MFIESWEEIGKTVLKLRDTECVVVAKSWKPKSSPFFCLLPTPPRFPQSFLCPFCSLHGLIASWLECVSVCVCVWMIWTVPACKCVCQDIISHPIAVWPHQPPFQPNGLCELKTPHVRWLLVWPCPRVCVCVCVWLVLHACGCCFWSSYLHDQAKCVCIDWTANKQFSDRRYIGQISTKGLKVTGLWLQL